MFNIAYTDTEVNIRGAKKFIKVVLRQEWVGHCSKFDERF